MQAPPASPCNIPTVRSAHSTLTVELSLRPILCRRLRLLPFFLFHPARFARYASHHIPIPTPTLVSIPLAPQSSAPSMGYPSLRSDREYDSLPKHLASLGQPFLGLTPFASNPYTITHPFKRFYKASEASGGSIQQRDIHPSLASLVQQPSYNPTRNFLPTPMFNRSRK